MALQLSSSVVTGVDGVLVFVIKDMYQYLVDFTQCKKLACDLYVPYRAPTAVDFCGVFFAQDLSIPFFLCVMSFLVKQNV